MQNTNQNFSSSKKGDANMISFNQPLIGNQINNENSQFKSSQQQTINVGGPKLLVKPKTNYMQRRLKYRSYNARNPYSKIIFLGAKFNLDIHSYMNTDGKPFGEEQNIDQLKMIQKGDRSSNASHLNTNSLYGNPKYQYLMNRLKKKQIQTERKTHDQIQIASQKENHSFSLEGQKARLIDNSLFSMMSIYSQQMHNFEPKFETFGRDQTLLSETDTPVEKKLQTKIYVQETRLLPESSSTISMHKLEPDQNTTSKSQHSSKQNMYNMPNFTTQNFQSKNGGKHNESNSSKQEQRKILELEDQNLSKTFQDNYHPSSTQQAKASNDVGSIILKDEIKSMRGGELNSNLSFISGSSPNQLSKNASTTMQLQPKLQHSSYINIVANNSSLTNQNNKIGKGKISVKDQLYQNTGQYIDSSIYHKEYQNSGQYTFKDLKFINEAVKQTLVKRQLSQQNEKIVERVSINSSQLKNEDINLLQISNVKNQDSLVKTSSQARNEKPLIKQQQIIAKQRQTLLLNKSANKGSKMLDDQKLMHQTLDNISEVQKSPLSIVSFQKSQILHSKYVINSRKNEDLTLILGNTPQNKGDEQSQNQLKGYFQQHRPSVDNISSSRQMDSTKNQINLMQMSFDIKINEKPKLSTKNNSQLESQIVKDDNFKISIENQEDHYQFNEQQKNLLNQIKIKDSSQSIIDENDIQDQNNLLNLILNQNSIYGEFISIQEQQKLDKLAEDIIKNVQNEGDRRQFREIRQLCLRYGLKDYQERKFVRNQKPFKVSPAKELKFATHYKSMGVSQNKYPIRNKTETKSFDRREQPKHPYQQMRKKQLFEDQANIREHQILGQSLNKSSNQIATITYNNDEPGLQSEDQRHIIDQQKEINQQNINNIKNSLNKELKLPVSFELKNSMNYNSGDVNSDFDTSNRSRMGNLIRPVNDNSENNTQQSLTKQTLLI